MRGRLFIISGQSGVGKNTILEAIVAKHRNFHRAVTYTTRDPRQDEIPGKDHFFVYRKKFQHMIKNKEFLEYARVHGEFYGTPKIQVEKALKANRNVLMEIDVFGAQDVKKLIPDAVLIFVKYEKGDLAERIRSRIKNDPQRKGVTEEEIKTRIKTARKESKYEKYYDYSVVNPEGHPKTAIGEVEEIIEKELKK